MIKVRYRTYYDKSWGTERIKIKVEVQNVLWEKLRYRTYHDKSWGTERIKIKVEKHCMKMRKPNNVNTKCI